MTINKAPWTTTHGWIYDADGELVGICWGKTPEEVEDNAQLISAAPEILEALETMVEMVEMDRFIQDYAMEIAREAIKKARGEE